MQFLQRMQRLHFCLQGLSEYVNINDGNDVSPVHVINSNFNRLSLLVIE